MFPWRKTFRSVFNFELIIVLDCCWRWMRWQGVAWSWNRNQERSVLKITILNRNQIILPWHRSLIYSSFWSIQMEQLTSNCRGCLRQTVAMVLTSSVNWNGITFKSRGTTRSFPWWSIKRTKFQARWWIVPNWSVPCFLAKLLVIWSFKSSVNNILV